MKKTSNTTNGTAYVPTYEQWGKMYSEWSDEMVQSLAGSGSYHDCRDAVQEAFLKMTGLSDHLHLQNELTPKVEACWYAFVRFHAKGILSSYHQRSRRFVHLEDGTFSSGGCAGEDGAPFYEVYLDDRCVQAKPCEEGDRRWLRDEVRAQVVNVCRAADVNERNIRAFIAYVLDGRDAAHVVEEFPEIRNVNNLYQIKNRVLKLLRASRGRFGEAHDNLLAA